MIRKILFIVIMFFVSINLSAQLGILQGNIKDLKTQEPLIGATIFINNTTATISNIDGSFILNNIESGIYDVRISYVSYNTKTIQGIKIDNKTTILNIELEENMVSLQDVTITQIKKINNEVFTINNIKNSSVVVNGVSAQLISKTQDKDASEVVKRLPGVSIVDDKFIIVRGLSSRYNNVWLNNSSTPSLESDNRSFSFDLIPSSIIDNIFIYKNQMAELPADFSGGFIKISTVGIPTTDNITVSYGTNFRENTVFNTFQKEQSTNLDLLTLGTDYRSLPKNIPNHLDTYDNNIDTKNKVTEIGRKLNNNWVGNQSIAKPDQKLQLSINKRFDKKFVAGNTTSLMYNYSNNTDEIMNNNFSIYDYKNNKSSYIDQFHDMKYKTTTKIGLLHNWTIYPINNMKIDFKNFASNIGESTISTREGIEWYNDGRYIKSEEIKYTQKFIYVGQLNIEQKFNDARTTVDLMTGYSLSKKNEPDIRRYKYISSTDTSSILIFGNNPDLSSLSRMWLKLNENVISVSTNFNHIFKSEGVFKSEIKTGLFFESKDRTFNARNFGYATSNSYSPFGNTNLPIYEIFQSENINLIDGLKLKEITVLSDSYSASNMILAGYGNYKLTYNKFDVSTGIRLENNIQKLNSYRQGTTIPVNTIRDTLNIFPSANLSYNINKKNLIRVIYGKSINRPEFREIAPFYYVDFDQNAGIYGNQNIKNSYIHNYDIRYEFYPKNNELFNIGLFYKKFNNPIEVVIMGNSPSQFSFDNVKSAFSYGIETELHKSLDFINLNNFSTIFNLSLIKSSVIFDRPLQGQSPYIINWGLYYENPKNNISTNIVYNRIGKRIIAVGRPSPNKWESIPHIYEMPRNEVNLNFNKRFNKFDIKLSIRDLFAENIKYQQDINTTVDMTVYGLSGIQHFDRRQIVKSVFSERQYFIGLSYKF